MKHNKSIYFSVFFLFFFLVSFSANIFRNIQSGFCKQHSCNTKTISISSKEENSCSGADLLLEKSENETKSDFQPQVFLLPFFSPYFRFDLVQTNLIPAQPLAELETSPIYIAVCNFRI